MTESSNQYADSASVEALRKAYEAAPKNCLGWATMVDLRNLAGLGWLEFDRTVIGLCREYAVQARWSDTSTAEMDAAAVLYEGTSRHRMIFGRWNELPDHNPDVCKWYPRAVGDHS